MCRAVLYMGNTTSINHFLYEPDNSLIKQSYNPRLMSHIQNLAGFGMAAWCEESFQNYKPFYYRTEQLPFFDSNLKYLADKINANCLLAHVRGVNYNVAQVITQQNAHPFYYDNYSLMLAHNGKLEEIDILKKDLLYATNAEVLRHRTGTTDTEMMYGILMSEFEDPTVAVTHEQACNAVVNMLQKVNYIRKKNKVTTSSPVNLFITNGNYCIVTRFVYDFGRNMHRVSKAFMQYHSLWYTYGEQFGCYDKQYKMLGNKQHKSICFASEPLTEDITTWIEVPEYSLVCAWKENGIIKIETSDLNID